MLAGHTKPTMLQLFCGLLQPTNKHTPAIHSGWVGSKTAAYFCSGYVYPTYPIECKNNMAYHASDDLVGRAEAGHQGIQRLGVVHQGLGAPCSLQRCRHLALHRLWDIKQQVRHCVELFSWEWWARTTSPAL
jgi:hypothetical protein